MKEKVDQYLEEINELKAKTIEDVDAFRIKYLSKKG